MHTILPSGEQDSQTFFEHLPFPDFLILLSPLYGISVLIVAGFLLHEDEGDPKMSKL